jgi:outer membrane protein OmpA-like peptidoglycan-associated protein
LAICSPFWQYEQIHHFLWLAVCLCAQAQTSGKYGVKNPQGSGFADVAAVAQDQQRLVLYRSPTARQAGVVALYINDQYHTALQHNTFSAVCLDRRVLNLRAKLRLNMGHQLVNLETELQLPAKPSQSHYVRVSEHLDGRPRLDAVSPNVALAELQTTRQQMHAHSRLANLRECQGSYQLPKPDPSELVVTLGADIWFAPRRTELKAMTAQSRQELEALIQKLDTQYKNTTQIRVQITGRADDTDDPYQNEELAKARAQTVSLYLLSNGLPTKSVHTEWSAAYSQNHPLDGYHNRRAELAVFINPN